MGCPRRQITPFTWQMIEFHVHYENGFLPFPGAVADQPNKVMQAITVIANRVAYNRAKNAPKT